MTDYYRFEIEFLNVDFDRYYIQSEEVNKTHHSHLYIRENEIELRILYNDKTYFGEKLSLWVSKIASKRFGTYIKVSNENCNNGIKKIDLSEAKLIGIQSSTSNYDGDLKFVIVKIDTIKLYWNPVKEEVNTAEFYLNDVGFKVVQPFYSFLFGVNEKYELKRMKNMDSFYKLEKSEFRPEFNAYSRDSRDNRIAQVIKEPKIQFIYNEAVSEYEAIFYGDIVRLLASFYFHSRIDYTFRRIYLPDYTIVIKNIEEKNLLEDRGTLWGFENYWSFNKLLLSNWQSDTLKNYKLLSKVVKLFIQAMLVDDYSEFLIRFNIIELCSKTNSQNEKFNYLLKGIALKNKCTEALNILLEAIDPSERELFKNKWSGVIGKLKYKPMKSPLISFLESQNLKTAEFPISFNLLKEIRDNITHGSIDKVNSEEVRKASQLLYRINGILILNLIGIAEWKLKTELL